MRILTITLILFLTACGLKSLDEIALEQPVFNPQKHLVGKFKGYGIFFDRQGNRATSFEIDLNGKLQDDKIILNELLKYQDGETLTRVYTISKTGNDEYQATASNGLKEPAKITAKGDTLKWEYDLEIKNKDSSFILHFDDYMFLQKDGSILNRSIATKFGIHVGDLFMNIKRL